jgi:hypothetical protein
MRTHHRGSASPHHILRKQEGTTMVRWYRYFWLSSLVLALVPFTGAVALAQEKEAAPGRASNQEVIDLLKKVIQKLEAQDAQQGRRPAIRLEKSPEKGEGQQAIRELEKARIELLKELQTGRTQNPNKEAPKPESPELQKARAEVQAGEQRLQEAKSRLTKLQGAPGTGWQVIERQPASPPPGAPDARRQALEKRLDALLREIEELRREIKKPR